MTLYRESQSTRVALNDDPPENSCRPSVDTLFKSAATVYGDRALAVVLTGMGQDGLRGSEWIHRSGGKVVVQDEATSVVWGMPGFVARKGLADAQVPLGAVAREIVQRVRDGRSPRDRAPSRAGAFLGD
jgi:two-component system chemotaxis response regulator CheB